MGTDGLIQQSDGNFDANEYNRQLKNGRRLTIVKYENSSLLKLKEIALQ